MSKKRVRNGGLTKLVLFGMFFVGVLIALYPFYINALNGVIDQYQLSQLQASISQQEKAFLAKEKANQELKKRGLQPGVVDFSQSNLSEQDQAYYQKHLLGQVVIPSLSLAIPFFDETNQHLLNRGAALLAGTSFPTGEKDTHTVLSAHSGLPERKLFTDLPSIKKGEIFILEVYNRKLAYEIFQMEEVLPAETDKLKLQAGESLATLITCTPYMVNTHRLLVTGRRVPYTEEIKKVASKVDNEQLQTNYLKLVAFALLLVVAVWLLYRLFKKWRLSCRRQDLVFHRLNQHYQAIIGARYQLFDGKGRKPIKRNGQNLIATSNQKGQIIFPDLPGKMYLLKELTPNSHFQVKVGIKKWRQSTFSFYPNKKQQSHIKKMVIQL